MIHNFRLTQVKDTESASETVILADSLTNCLNNKNVKKPYNDNKVKDTTENFDTFIEKIK